MKIYIDQSWKIEDTNKQTVIAYSNLTGTKNKSITISASDKKEVQKIFRRAGKPDIFIYKTFAILIFLLIKNDLKSIDEIIIDMEYVSREPVIKKFLLELIRRNGRKFESEKISFTQIGKKNPAHNAAISVFRKRKKPNIKANYKDILQWSI